MTLGLRLLAVALLLLGQPLSGQEPALQPEPSVGNTLFWGAVAGVGLGTAFIDPDGERWILSDGAALVAATGTGVLMAFLARGGFPLPEDASPAVVVSVGKSFPEGWEYSLGYRVPTDGNVSLETSLLVVNQTSTKSETQTRCNGGFCATGDYVTDYDYRQVVAGLGRGVVRLPGLPLSWSAGLGVAATRWDDFDFGISRDSGVLLDSSVATEGPGRLRIRGEAGARMGPLGSNLSSTRAYVRIGWAWMG
jgi:hypothetical protein